MKYMFVAVVSFAMAACSSSTNNNNAGNGGGSDGGSSSTSSGASTCVDQCVAHETGCGAPSPQSFCEQTCTTYKPLAWEVACAKKVECGDNDGLMACLPDLDCQSKCVAHEKNCGDPSPEAGCQQLCSDSRPTTGQTKCAQAVACGDKAGLADCIKPQ
ncbi:MAG: hypothetical protein HOO96_44325 [Polyangiaceae bacterium]|nr:hypothetical protein [Polyangiaceae bacterium]